MATRQVLALEFKVRVLAPEFQSRPRTACSIRSVHEHTFVPEGKHAWARIRRYYEAGHTRTECQEEFGFSNGAWDRAVSRGDIVARPRSSGIRASEKRARVGELRKRGLSYSEIAFELGLTKTTVAYYAPASRDSGRRKGLATIRLG